MSLMLNNYWRQILVAVRDTKEWFQAMRPFFEWVIHKVDQISDFIWCLYYMQAILLVINSGNINKRLNFFGIGNKLRICFLLTPRNTHLWSSFSLLVVLYFYKLWPLCFFFCNFFSLFYLAERRALNGVLIVDTEPIHLAQNLLP